MRQWYCDAYTDGFNKGYEKGKREAQPERKKGHWIVNADDESTISGSCSACGWQAHLYEDDVVGMNFCPNCGCRMGGDEK